MKKIATEPRIQEYSRRSPVSTTMATCGGVQNLNQSWCRGDFSSQFERIGSCKIVRADEIPCKPKKRKRNGCTTAQFNGWQFEPPTYTSESTTHATTTEPQQPTMQREKFEKKHARKSSLPEAFFSTLMGKKSNTANNHSPLTKTEASSKPEVGGSKTTSVVATPTTTKQSLVVATIPSITTTAATPTTSSGDRSGRGGVGSTTKASTRRNQSPAVNRDGVTTTSVSASPATATTTTATPSQQVSGDANKMKTVPTNEGALVHQGSSNNSDTGASNHQDDETDVSGVGGDSMYDVIGGATPSGNTEDQMDGRLGGLYAEDLVRMRHSREHLQAKIDKTMQQMKDEQARKEENVNEYLRLARNADKQQLSRIKAVFEKKNKTLTHNIAHLQRKLDAYNQKVEMLEKHGAYPSSSGKSRHVLKDMGQGLKGVVDSVRGAKDSFVSKPKEFAHKIKNKFGSADNINTLKGEDDMYDDGDPDKSALSSNNLARSEDGDDIVSLLSSSSNRSNTGQSGLSGLHPTCDVERIHPTSAPYPPSNSESADVLSGVPGSHSGAANAAPGAYAAELLHASLLQLTQQQQKLQETMDGFKVQFEEETHHYKTLVEEERYRSKCLEEQINDLLELHQHEVTNIKQELQSMEEKMEYQLEERTRDMQELLETCQTRITKMELQQQQQQIISMETFENSNFRNLITKLINVVLAVLAVILVLVSTITNILAPFIYSRFRLVSTVVLIVAIALMWRNWATVTDWSTHLLGSHSHWLPWANG